MLYAAQLHRAAAEPLHLKVLHHLRTDLLLLLPLTQDPPAG
jgi:hypothetical protein